MPLLPLPHGPRHADSRADAVSLTAASARLLGTVGIPAFLDFDEVTLARAAAQLRADGHTHATVVPLLFTDAYHHRHDVPEAVEQARQDTGLDITVAPHLGTGADIAQLLIDAAPRDRELIIYSVGSSDPQANAAVADLASRVGEAVGAPCTSVLATVGGPAEVAAHPGAHVLALTVSSGLLRDALVAELAGSGITVDAPLGLALAGVVADRYRAATP
ncbi:sirohydrochlorin chelatase [Corynebacterium sp. Marseille-Q2516]